MKKPNKIVNQKDELTSLNNQKRLSMLLNNCINANEIFSEENGKEIFVTRSSRNNMYNQN